MEHLLSFIKFNAVFGYSLFRGGGKLLRYEINFGKKERLFLVAVPIVQLQAVFLWKSHRKERKKLKFNILTTGNAN